MNGIELFVQVAQQGSLVAAGRQLGLSASAVGKSLARLEARLGVRLVQRSTRRLALTAAGSQFLLRCRRILEELDAAEQELQHGQAEASGPLRLGLPHDCGLLTPHLAAFMQRYPAVTLELDYSDRLVDVIGEGFDLVVRGGEPGDSRLAARRLGDYRMLLVAAPAYLAAHGAPQTAADLDRHRCLHYRYPSSGKLAPWPLPEPAAALPVSARCNTSEALILLAQQGAGIACLPDFAVRRQLADGSLQALLTPTVSRSGSMYLLWPRQTRLPARLRLLIDFLSQRVFALPSADPPQAAGI